MVNNELIKDDLYMAVNGDWLKTAKIPADKAATGGFYDLADDIEKTLMEDFANFMTGDSLNIIVSFPILKNVMLMDLNLLNNTLIRLLP